MKRAAVVPFWAWQFLGGSVVVLLCITVFAVVVGAALRVPSSFLDDIGKTVSRVAPQPSADVGSEDQLKKVIGSMPNGRLRVATVTAERSSVHAAVQPGDELRIARDGSVEIAPTGIAGLFDQLQRAMEDLKKKWFGQ